MVDTGDNAGDRDDRGGAEPAADASTRRCRRPPTAGATEVRLASYTTATTGGPNAPTVNGPIAGQPIVLDTGANQEVISVASHIVPLPAAPAPNVVLIAPLAKTTRRGRPLRW